jgi:TolB-like protein/Flp pilus assembly protein TadD
LGVESPTRGDAHTGSVFLSYASEDAGAAERIATTLRAGGIEVWFDQSQLRGGDAWDRRIRQQIQDSRLFIAVISSHTEARDEGYFRREWKLAVDRTHDMAEGKAFLIPVVIDGTTERGASVPDKFRELQWTRLPGGDASAAFVERVRRLLSPDPTAVVNLAGVTRDALPSARSVSRRAGRRAAFSVQSAVRLGIAAVLVLTLVYLVIDKFWPSNSVPTTPAVASADEKPGSKAGSTPSAATAFNPPPHSIAVLPFVNMSGDKDQEYFSEGLTEELLNSLARINELQVAARTSSFSFQGEHPHISAVARKLNVGAVLEGSVRRSGHTVRITTQLINGVTGFHLWSQTYDRDLGDVLKLQTDIATAVASALKVTLLGDEAAKIEVGGTRNPAAFDAYLRGTKVYQSRNEDKEIATAIADYTEAIRLDPNFALAFAGRAYAFANYVASVLTGTAMREGFQKAQADARHAIALAPDLAQAHMALAFVLEIGSLDIERTNQEYDKALALAPGNAEVLWNSGRFAAEIGRFEGGIAATERAVVLDPLGRLSHSNLGRALYSARRYEEAAAAFAQVTSLYPNFKQNYGEWGLALYELGDLEKARATCETGLDDEGSHFCLALVYDKLKRHADAEAQLAKIKVTSGDDAAYSYAEIYAQWGDRAKALEWLDTAMRVRDADLSTLKVDPLVDPLRNEPRFQAIERALKFPD